ncbi:hypothetical protein AND_001754 [Anopheles darlingi]|uniref:Rad21/Rec8-like protein N-terminal domain-containing protein n=1 Tax=Anopheles darlingi TaxID=43151 RepID=W5JT52_ANODA|nr:hypothetical protein AND_001754 [Anopheles darlingi]
MSDTSEHHNEMQLQNDFNVSVAWLAATNRTVYLKRAEQLNADIDMMYLCNLVQNLIVERSKPLGVMTRIASGATEIFSMQVQSLKKLVASQTGYIRSIKSADDRKRKSIKVREVEVRVSRKKRKKEEASTTVQNIADITLREVPSISLYDGKEMSNDSSFGSVPSKEIMEILAPLPGSQETNQSWVVDQPTLVSSQEPDRLLQSSVLMEMDEAECRHNVNPHDGFNNEMEILGQSKEDAVLPIIHQNLNEVNLDEIEHPNENEAIGNLCRDNSALNSREESQMPQHNTLVESYEVQDEVKLPNRKRKANCLNKISFKRYKNWLSTSVTTQRCTHSKFDVAVIKRDKRDLNVVFRQPLRRSALEYLFERNAVLQRTPTGEGYTAGSRRSSITQKQPLCNSPAPPASNFIQEQGSLEVSLVEPVRDDSRTATMEESVNGSISVSEMLSILSSFWDEVSGPFPFENMLRHIQTKLMAASMFFSILSLNAKGIIVTSKTENGKPTYIEKGPNWRTIV